MKHEIVQNPDTNVSTATCVCVWVFVGVYLCVCGYLYQGCWLLLVASGSCLVSSRTQITLKIDGSNTFAIKASTRWSSQGNAGK